MSGQRGGPEGGRGGQSSKRGPGEGGAGGRQPGQEMEGVCPGTPAVAKTEDRLAGPCLSSGSWHGTSPKGHHPVPVIPACAPTFHPLQTPCLPVSRKVLASPTPPASQHPEGGDRTPFSSPMAPWRRGQCLVGGGHPIKVTLECPRGEGKKVPSTAPS